MSQHNDPDSSDYGSDFTTDEEELINQLLTQAQVAAEHAPVESATPTSSSTPRATPFFATANNSTPKTAAHTALTRSLQSPSSAATVPDIEDGIEPPATRLPKVLGREKPRSPWKQHTRQKWGKSHLRALDWRGDQVRAQTTVPLRLRLVEDPSSTEGRQRERERVAAREQEWTQQEQLLPTLDPRSPVERFRRPPNKAFSVTDLISPAWCELQYWYTLTKHGRKRRTAAMKTGSVVHKSLEDQIYTTVPVDITTKEDAWALRIWNVIQGLRMLRQYGITRELEVWGLIDGELVNGVIDQLSYECPDSELEATAAKFYEDAAASRAALPEYQMSLSDFLLSSSQGGRRLSDLGQTDSVSLGGPLDPAPSTQEFPSAAYDLPRIYMTDVKTRGSRSIPTVKSTSFRPTSLQLQLYYHMLSRLLTSDDVTIDLLAERYLLDTEKPFTDVFIKEVGDLDGEFFDALSSQEFDIDNPPTPEDARRISQGSGSGSSSPPRASQDSTSILLTHGNLSKLWSHMKEQLRYTFIPNIPETSSIAPSIPHHTQPELLQEYPTLLSPVLTARFLSSAPTDNLESRLLGSRSFLFDPTNMNSYIDEQMEWWRGQRDPNGVGIAEAWKCRICEFRDECTWRQEHEWALARRNQRRSTSVSAT